MPVRPAPAPLRNAKAKGKKQDRRPFMASTSPVNAPDLSATPDPVIFFTVSFYLFFGGEGGIRTLGTLASSPVFETGLFNQLQHLSEI